ncbi:MAG: MinD/ParA family protein [Christensenellales bacterium]|jgi:flagellar biosynthesis protein FlhG
MMDQAQSLRKLMERKKESGIQVITVTSAKGGVGKSSIALNMAIALSMRGKRTLIVDTDFGLANIDVMLGIRAQHDLTSVIQGKKDIRQIMEVGVQGVQFISGGSGMEELLKLAPQDMQIIIDQLLGLREHIDVIIFDTGAGINENIIRMMCASHITWLVTTPEPTAMMDAYALVKVADRETVKPHIELIVNRAKNEREADAAMKGFIQIAGKYTNIDIKAFGYILNDEHMTQAVKRQEPLLISFPGSLAAGNIRTLANRFCAFAPAGNKTGFSGFLERLLKKKAGG